MVYHDEKVGQVQLCKLPFRSVVNTEAYGTGSAKLEWIVGKGLSSKIP